MQNSRQSCTSSCDGSIVSNSSAFAFRLCDLVDLCSSGVSRIYGEKNNSCYAFCKSFCQCVDNCLARPLSKRRVTRSTERPATRIPRDHPSSTVSARGLEHPVTGKELPTSILLSYYSNAYHFLNDSTKDEAIMVPLLFQIP